MNFDMQYITFINIQSSPFSLMFIAPEVLDRTNTVQDFVQGGSEFTLSV